MVYYRSTNRTKWSIPNFINTKRCFFLAKIKNLYIIRKGDKRNANNIIIRSIEDKDKINYLKLFNEETFGCIGTNETQKPSIYEEEKIDVWEYHIGEFVIEQSQINQGYGSYLLETIKSYADSEGCNISLECLSSAQSFFSNHGFKKSEINFKYETRNYKEQTTQSPIFLDYEQKKKLKQKNKKE